MAAITWREIAAPNLDVRNLAIAGSTIANGFDRFAQMLYDRETAMQKRATDDAIASVLANQDPNAGPVDVSQFGGRVNARAVLEAANAHRANLLDQSLTREELATAQDPAKYGTAYARLEDALRRNDTAAADTIVANELAGARRTADARSRGIGYYDMDFDNASGRARDAETARHNRAGEANDAARVALAREQAAAERSNRAALDQGFNLASQFADKYRLTDTASAAALLQDDADYKALPANVKRTLLGSFKDVHGALTTETAETRGQLRGLDSGIAGRLSALTAEGNRAEAQAKDPSLTSLRRAGTYTDKITMDQLSSDLAGRMGWAQNQSGARDGIQKLLTDVPGATLEDVRAAIDVHGFDPGVWKNIPFADILANRSEGAALRERVQQSVDARLRGYTANEAVDVAAARAPSEAKARQIQTLRAEIGLYVRAGQPVPADKEARLAELLGSN